MLIWEPSNTIAVVELDAVADDWSAVMINWRFANTFEDIVGNSFVLHQIFYQSTVAYAMLTWHLVSN